MRCVQRRGGALVLAAVMGVVLAACGSSASSAERTRLTNELSAQLKTTGAPSDLASCVAQQSRGLPLTSVRELAHAGSNPPAATRRAGAHLFATCVAQGKGVAWLRASLLQSVQQSGSSGMPAALMTCIEQKVNAIQPSELASLMYSATAAQPGVAETRGRRLGVEFAEQCFTEPALRSVLLGQFLGPVERGLNAGHYSIAFKHCLLGKLRKIASSEIVRLAVDPAAASSVGIQIGRRAAQACIASGAKP